MNQLLPVLEIIIDKNCFTMLPNLYDSGAQWHVYSSTHCCEQLRAVSLRMSKNSVVELTELSSDSTDKGTVGEKLEGFRVTEILGGHAGTRNGLKRQMGWRWWKGWLIVEVGRVRHRIHRRGRRRQLTDLKALPYKGTLLGQRS